MSGPKQQLHQEEPSEEVTDSREVYLRDGRKLVLSESGGEQLVEIRAESGMVELRIRLTEQGPVLHVEAVRMQLKATEAVEIESPKVEIKAAEQLQLQGGSVTIDAEQDVKVDAEGEVRVVGKTIHLN